MVRKKRVRRTTTKKTKKKELNKKVLFFIALFVLVGLGGLFVYKTTQPGYPANYLVAHHGGFSGGFSIKKYRSCLRKYKLNSPEFNKCMGLVRPTRRPKPTKTPGQPTSPVLKPTRDPNVPTPTRRPITMLPVRPTRIPPKTTKVPIKPTVIAITNKPVNPIYKRDYEALIRQCIDKYGKNPNLSPDLNKFYNCIMSITETGVITK
jgi:hypothetical protein